MNMLDPTGMWGLATALAVSFFMLVFWAYVDRIARCVKSLATCCIELQDRTKQDAQDLRRDTFKYRQSVEEEFRSIKSGFGDLKLDREESVARIDQLQEALDSANNAILSLVSDRLAFSNSIKNEVREIACRINQCEYKSVEFGRELAKGQRDQITLNHVCLADMARVFNLLAAEYKPAQNHAFHVRRPSGMDKLDAIEQGLKGK
jgi:hypothetical protein